MEIKITGIGYKPTVSKFFCVRKAQNMCLKLRRPRAVKQLRVEKLQQFPIIFSYQPALTMLQLLSPVKIWCIRFYVIGVPLP